MEIGDEAIKETRTLVAGILHAHGANKKDIKQLTYQWIKQADFLVDPITHGFTHIVGNPPYIRQEDLPKPLLDLYRNSYSTMYDRADIYIPFIERSLSLLNEGGILGFICSDRWMKNRYGGPLRKLISESYTLDCHIDLTNCPVFDSEVVAYPAITILSNSTSNNNSIKKSEETISHACYRPIISKDHLSVLAKALRGESSHPDVVKATSIVQGKEPWLLDNFERLQTIRRIENSFDLIEDQNCKIGIGVASGADKV